MPKSRTGEDFPGKGRTTVAGDEKLGEGHPAMWFQEPVVDFAREAIPGLRPPGSGGREGGNGHNPTFAIEPTVEMEPFPDGGGYPKGFLRWAYSVLGAIGEEPVVPAEVLHLCSGSVRTGITVDIRPEMKPTIVADVRSVPLPDASIGWILADPPYSREYAANLYGTASVYPRPQQILREAARLLRPRGLIGLLHFQVPMVPAGAGLTMVRVYGITTGGGYAIRAWTVLRKADEDLGL